MTRCAAILPLPAAYDLKRKVATLHCHIWHADDLTGLPAAPVYLFPDQQAFDSDDVDALSRSIMIGPLQLPHLNVIFEVTDADDHGRAIVVYATQGESAVDAFLFARAGRDLQWTEVICHARFLPDGVADVVANPMLPPDPKSQTLGSILTGVVWRALGLLKANTPVQEGCVSRLRRSMLAKCGVTGWSYRVASIDLSVLRKSDEVGTGTHASPRWHVRRGHWRQIGEGRRVFVRECQVGDLSRGGVVKDYQVELENAA